jgi:hypothetical protein
MHRRKRFLIYPPNYQPGDGYLVRYSKFQAWKAGVRLGAGAAIDVSVHTHPAPFKNWTSSAGRVLWNVTDASQEGVET